MCVIVVKVLMTWKISFLSVNSKTKQELKSAIMDVWNDSENSEKSRITVPLLLAPAVSSNFSSSDCRAILCSTFKFIQQSGLSCKVTTSVLI